MSDVPAYVTLSLLGSGQFGQVLLVRRDSDRKLFAAKIPHGEDAPSRQASRQEAQLLMSLNHINIIQCIELVEDDKQLAIVMEYASGGDLDAFLRVHQETREFLSESVIMRIFIQIVLALQYLHEHHVLHRDLKPKNILLDGDGIVKLSDFGVSKVLQNSLEAAHTVTGTPFYMAPELLENATYDGKSDVWSLGCVLYELATYAPPFTGSALGAVVHQILTCDPPQITQQYSPPFKALIARLLEKDHHKRPGISDILSCDAVQHYMKQLVSVATSHQPMLLEQFAADHQVYRCSPKTPRWAVPSQLVSPLPNHQYYPKIKDEATSNTMEKLTPQRDDGDLARQLFFENQAAARRNKERVDQERACAAVFLDTDDAELQMKAQMQKSNVVNGDRRRCTEESARVTNINDRQALKRPIAAATPSSPRTRTKSSPANYEELLEVERRRVRLETKALQERMRAVHMTETQT